MITLAELDRGLRRVRVRGRAGTITDYHDDSGTGTCEVDPWMIRVQYDDTRVSDELNNDQVVVLNA